MLDTWLWHDIMICINYTSMETNECDVVAVAVIVVSLRTFAEWITQAARENIKRKGDDEKGAFNLFPIRQCRF